MPVQLSTQLDRDDAVPYFLWDQPMTVAELRQRLDTASPPERARLLGKVLREARDPDVWRFTTPEAVLASWDDLSRHLGRRRAFWEYLLERWRADGLIVVDLVLDRTPRGEQEQQVHGDITVDRPEEILANKLCTLLSRAEIRDVVDVLALERAGHDLESALRLAATKDAGMTPAQLAWVLSQIQIGNDAEVPGDYSVGDLRAFLESLQQRLARMAFPDRRE